MLEQPRTLTAFDRDAIHLGFGMWLARMAWQMRVDSDTIFEIVTGAEPANEKAVAVPPAEEGTVARPSSAPITEAPTPLPDDDEVHRPAEEKTSDQEPSVSDGSGGVQDGLPVHPATNSKPGKSGEGAGAPSSAPTLKDRILALHAEHPGLTAIEAADTLGVKRTSVSAYSSSLGIRWATAVQRRDGMGERVAEMHAAHRDWPASRIAEELGVVAPYVRATAKRKGFILPPESARSGSGRREAPTPAPEPESPPAAVRQPIAAIPSGSGSAIITKPIAKPKGTQFYLRNDVGEYLHCSCESMTSDRNYAWRGNEQHLVAVRRRFPLAQDLREQVIEKEQARAAA